MKKLNSIFWAFAVSSLFLISCSSDDNNVPDVPLGAYDNGLFVVNEGNSTVTTASITFISNSGQVEQDVFRTVNPTAIGTGTYLQSLFFDDTRAFIISGDANKITVVDRYTFKFIATIDTDFDSPRYGVVFNGKAYVTNAVDFTPGGNNNFVTVIDLSNYSTSKVALNRTAEKITAENGKIYISNGYYGVGTTVSVFNPVNNTIDKVIELGYVPDSFEEDNGVLYVLGSKIAKINLTTNEMIGAPVALPAVQNDAKNLNIEGGKMYYTVDTSVYAMSENATTAPTTALFSYVSNSDFGAMYGFAVNGDRIYIADGGDFSSDSKIFTYTLTGTLDKTFNVGVGPNGFYFND